MLLQPGIRIACNSPEALWERSWLVPLGIASKQQVDDPELHYGVGAVVPIGPRIKPSQEYIKGLLADPDTDPSQIVRIVRVPLAPLLKAAALEITANDPSSHRITNHGPTVALSPTVSGKFAGVIEYDFDTPPLTTTVVPGNTPNPSMRTSDEIKPGDRMGLHADRWYDDNPQVLTGAPNPHHLMVDVREASTPGIGFLRSAMVLPNVNLKDVYDQVGTKNKDGIPNVKDIRRWVAMQPAGSVNALMIDHGQLVQNDDGVFRNYEAWVADTDLVIHDARALRSGAAFVVASFIDPPDVNNLELAV